jgi:hypothetical protein
MMSCMETEIVHQPDNLLEVLQRWGDRQDPRLDSLLLRPGDTAQQATNLVRALLQ